MTTPKPTKEDVEALIEAAKQVTDFLNGYNLQSNVALNKKRNLDTALTKFAPKPAKVYVLPKFQTLSKNADYVFLTDAFGERVKLFRNVYNALRELTATEAAEQKWNMPTWDEMPKEGHGMIALPNGDWVGQGAYEPLRDKIMAMND